MSSGFVTETAPHVLLRGATTKRMGTVSQNLPLSQMRFPFYRYSYRSGVGFDRALVDPDAKVSYNQPTLIEDLLRLAKVDLGHEYEIRANSIVLARDTLGEAQYHILPGTWLSPTKTAWDDDILGSLRFPTTAISATAGGSDSDLKAWGTRAIALTDPTTPPVNLGVDLGDLLLDGLPSGIGRALVEAGPKRTQMIRAAAGDYLNYVFGLTPVVSDVKKIAELLQSSFAIINQWKRDSGRQVRRQYRDIATNTFTNIHINRVNGVGVGLAWLRPDSTTPVNAYVEQAQHSGTSAQKAVAVDGYWSEKVVRDFSGAFEYKIDQLLPEGDPVFDLITSGSSRDQIVDALLYFHSLGLSPKDIKSPEQFYQLTPFSWLLDWFVNVGDMIHFTQSNLSMGLKLDYGYVTSTWEWQSDLRFKCSFNNAPLISGHSIFKQYRVRRVRATPFGFGTTFAGLSAQQVGILSALLASRKVVT